MGFLKLKCLNCKKIFEETFNLQDVEIEHEATDERNMGPEYTYTMYKYTECPICGENAEIRIDFWEYPIGALNYVEENPMVDGNVKVIECSVDDIADKYIQKKFGGSYEDYE